jgi:uncharacterized protein (TIGR00645 family)
MTEVTEATTMHLPELGAKGPPGRSQRPMERYLGAVIFASRWLQAPLYVGLIVAQAIYVVIFVEQLVHLAGAMESIKENDIMLIVLGLIDVVMISNLLIMVIIGGYETFVARLHMDGHPDRPEWLSHVNANVLKVKLAMALIGISSIHLLETFINIENIATKDAMWRVIIHIVFLFSAIALAFTSRISEGPAVAEARNGR